MEGDYYQRASEIYHTPGFIIPRRYVPVRVWVRASVCVWEPVKMLAMDAPGWENAEERGGEGRRGEGRWGRIEGGVLTPGTIWNKAPRSFVRFPLAWEEARPG